jgi:hypothetical protein
VHALCQLTGLKYLRVIVPSALEKEGLLLQLTKLKQLTTLAYLIPKHPEPGSWVINQYELLRQEVG